MTHVAMPPKKKSEKKSKEYIWTDDNAQLLLEVAHDYKIKHLAEGTCWESVKMKYFSCSKKNFPKVQSKPDTLLKIILTSLTNYLKEVLTSKLKAIRTKFCEVSHQSLY